MRWNITLRIIFCLPNSTRYPMQCTLWGIGCYFGTHLFLCTVRGKPGLAKWLYYSYSHPGSHVVLAMRWFSSWLSWVPPVPHDDKDLLGLKTTHFIWEWGLCLCVRPYKGKHADTHTHIQTRTDTHAVCTHMHKHARTHAHTPQTPWIHLEMSKYTMHTQRHREGPTRPCPTFYSHLWVSNCLAPCII